MSKVSISKKHLQALLLCAEAIKDEGKDVKDDDGTEILDSAILELKNAISSIKDEG